MPKLKKSGLYCCITSCKNYLNSKSKVELHKLPDDFSHKKKFCDILGIPYDVADEETTRVCSLHFKSKLPVDDRYVQYRIKDTPTMECSLKNGEPGPSNAVDNMNPAFQNMTYNTQYGGQYLITDPGLLNPVSIFNPTFGNTIYNVESGPPPITFFLQNPVSNASSNYVSILKPTTVTSASGLASTTENEISISSSDSENSNDNCVESPEFHMDLQCDEELLSQPQLNAYYSELVSFITANQRVQKIPVPAQTATISTQTDHVTILYTDKIVPLEESIKALKQTNEEEDEITIVKDTLAEEVTSAKINQLIESNTELLKNFQLPYMRCRGERQEPVSTPLEISSISSASTYSSSNTTIPAPNVSMPDMNSKLYSYLSKAPASIPPNVRVQFKPPPSQAGTIQEPVNEVYPNANLPSQTLYSGIVPVGNSMYPASNQLTKIVQTNSGLILSCPNPNTNQLQNLSGLPANQGVNMPFLPFAVNNNLKAVPYQTYSSFHANTPVQMLTQNFGNANTSSILQQETASTENDCDKDGDLLGLCNVATVYGSDSPQNSSSPKNPVISEEDDQQNMFLEPSAGDAITVDKSETMPPPVSQSESWLTNHTGPLIVDVLSATEGAKDYYVGDKMPNILYDKILTPNSDNSNKNVNFSYRHLTKLPNAPSVKTSDEVEKAAASTSSSGDKSTQMHLIPGTKQKINVKSSVFSMQSTIPIISNGSRRCADAQTYLCYLKIPTAYNAMEADMLRERLRKEKFITCSVWWLVRRNYMPVVNPCVCESQTFILQRDMQLTNGFVWECANDRCGNHIEVKKPKFFEQFKHTMEELLLLTYHWACQTPIQTVLLDVSLSCDDIFEYYQALQILCHKSLVKKGKLGLSSVVEASLVKLGSYFILGAYDRATKFTRLQAISLNDAYNTSVHIQLLDNWLADNAVLVTENKIGSGSLKRVTKMQSERGCTGKRNDEAHIINVSNYLSANLTALFSGVDHCTIPLDVIKGYLYELQWRAKYGKFFDMAFWSIMNHIKETNETSKTRITARPGNLDIEGYCKIMKYTLNKRWGSFHLEKLEKAEEKVVKKTSPKKKKSIFKKEDIFMKSPTKKQVTFSRGRPICEMNTKSIWKDKEAKDLFHHISLVYGGSANVTSKSLLAIKIRCEDTSPGGVYKPNATSLGLQLRKEGFISEPVKWLVRRGYLNDVAPCYICKAPAKLTTNSKFNDGMSWTCENIKCKFENMFKRPIFFARFHDRPMAQIAAMIFHWTVQSDFNIVNSDVPSDPIKLCHAWRAFQVLCSYALKREQFKVGGEDLIVEVALVQFGKLYILGARQRNTQRTLLRCFNKERCDQGQFVRDTLRSWIVPLSHVVVNATEHLDLQRYYKVFSADTSITDKSDTRMHVLNVTAYIMKQVSQMFGHLKADMVKSHVMQVYLDELMWRERFGKQPSLAFAKIMYEIFYNEKNNTTAPLLNQHINDLLDEEPSNPAHLKEVRIVLHRIPETVLKYYNCLPSGQNLKRDSIPGTSNNNEHSYASQYEERSRMQDGFKFNYLVKTQSIDSKGKEIPKKSVFRGRRRNTKDNRFEDDESSSSTDSGSEEEESWSGDGYHTSPSSKTSSSESSSDEISSNSNVDAKSTRLCNKRQKMLMDVKDIKKEPTSDPEDVPQPTNAVMEPLVIKKNGNKTLQSYFKSDLLKAKYQNQRFRKRKQNHNWSSPKTRKAKARQASKKAPKSNSSNFVPDVAIKQEVLDDYYEAGPSGISQSADLEVPDIKPRLQADVLRNPSVSPKRICIECGKEVFFEHFMRRFNCTDCTKSIYSTCCRNAFFEHRSALLFGKRPPRREKVSYGIHRSLTLSYSVSCACGFTSRKGNQMATHMVKCRQTTCFL